MVTCHHPRQHEGAGRTRFLLLRMQIFSSVVFFFGVIFTKRALPRLSDPVTRLLPRLSSHLIKNWTLVRQENSFIWVLFALLMQWQLSAWGEGL